MRTLWWILAILVWAASAFFSWMVMSAVAMFNGLNGQPVYAWLFFLAPVVALAAAAVGLLFRRKAAWLPATLLLSPVLQGVGHLWARMETIV